MISFCKRTSGAGALLCVWVLALGLGDVFCARFALAETPVPDQSEIDSTAALALPDAGPQDVCAALTGERHAIVAITNEATLLLDDGSDVRLAGLLFPGPPLAVKVAPGAWPPQQAARTALTNLGALATLQIAVTGTGRDRHGRPFAQAYADRGNEKLWVQRELVEQGHALVSSRSGGSAPCLRTLLGAEAEARHNKRGLWASAPYQVHNASEPNTLWRLRSNFALVEGKVLNIAARSGRLFLNFGDDWRTDFTAVVPKNLLTAAPGEAEKLQSLKGHTIRVRGWIERRYGPSIEIFSLSDLEDLTAPGGVTAP